METMQQNEGPKKDRVPEPSEDGLREKLETAAIERDDQTDEGSEALAAAEAQAAEFKDKYLRTAADMENMRRRFEKERSDLLQYGLEKIVTDLLPVMDAFEKAHADAAASVGCEKSSLFEGLELLQKQLASALEKHGLAELNPEGLPFDPNFHQAIQKIDSAEVEVESVQVVYQKGYTLNKRLVRPAMVCVAVPSGQSDKNN